MRCFFWGLLVVGLLGFAGCQNAVSDAKSSDARSGDAALRSGDSQSSPDAVTRRHFEFVYGATITDLAPGAEADVWIPVASDTLEQTVKRLDDQMRLPEGVTPKITTEKRFGNQVMHFKAKADAEGKIGPIKIVYQVHRKEILPGQTEKADQEKIAEFLKASEKVPVDGTILGKLYGQEKPAGDDSMAIGREIYDIINDRMKYDKPAGKPWGNGDARWACDSRFGNCTDFHSQFNAAMRDLGIAAKFEIGFTIPNDKEGRGTVGGYHCWAKFVAGDHWIPVDISESNKIKKSDAKLADYYFGNMSPNRMTFTSGRDLKLDPPTAQGPVNFLVYPYVEVDGKWHKAFKKQFSYRNL